MNRKNIRNIIDLWTAKLVFLYLILGIYVFGRYIYCNYSDLLEEDLIAFVVLATSIVGGVFLFVRIYIDNQLSIKEKEMLKEYSDKVEEVKKDFAEKLVFQLSSQSEDINKKFATQSANISQLNTDISQLTTDINQLNTQMELIVNIVKSLDDLIKKEKNGS